MRASPTPRAGLGRRAELGERTAIATPRSTVIAPTGTIGLVMDCDTTGIEPGLRAGEVQEAGRRRLLQDHQPRWCRRRSQAGLQQKRDRRDHRLRGGSRHAEGAPCINHEALKAKGFGQARSTAKSRRRWVRPSTSGFAFNKWTLGEAFCLPSPLGSPSPNSSTIRRSTCWPSWASPRPRSRPRTPACCGAMTLEGAPRPEGRAPAGVRLRQSVRPHRQAVSVGRQPHPHDGGGPAFISGAISKTINMPATRPRSRIARTPTSCPGGWR